MTQKKSTGFKELDKLTGGLPDGSLVVIGSRPGMGKTALALDMARFLAAEQKATILILSYEASTQQIARLLDGKSRKEEAMGLSGAELPIHVYDGPDTTAEMLRICKNMENLGAVVIDYFQLLSNTASPSQADLIAHSLKEMARELNVPVICTSQLSRACENRADHRPILGDMPSPLRQEADQIFLLYRDRYYNRESPWGDIAECIVARNRYGNVGTVKLRWNPKRVSFSDIGEQTALEKEEQK